MLRFQKSAWLLTALLFAASPGFAHTGEQLNGLTSGLLHPVTGLDHVVAMIAVGLWGGILGKPAIWLLPVVFPLAMAISAAAGVAGIPLPGAEVGIALSGVVLGLMVLFAAKPPIWTAALLVGIFAVFHGHAHGVELPEAANSMVYAVGFVVSTGVLHLTGIAIGQLGNWPAGKIAVRAAGAAIALAGGAFLTGLA